MSEKQESHEGPGEDVKAKFREALERKHAHGGKDVSDHGGHGKVGRGGEAHKNKMFRRKAGG